MDALLGVAFVAQLPSQQPEVIFQYPPPRAVSFGKTEGASEGHQRLDSGRSVEDLSAQQRECFGVPAKIFAKLMLPDEEICNRPFYLEMDGGERETSHRHDLCSHLHFSSFPCNVSEFCSAGGEAAQPSGDNSVYSLAKVQRFNIVHVLDSRRISRLEKHASTLWQVSAHLSRALVSEEVRVGYLSKEVRRLSRKHHDIENLCISTDWQSNLLALDSLVADMYEGVHQHGYRSLHVNGNLLCQVCIFPKDEEAQAPPSAAQALALLCPREQLLQELPFDSADVVRSVISSVTPTTSLGELMIRLALPLSTLQRVAQHLVFWKKARVVDVFKDQTRVALAPGVDTGPDSLPWMQFHEWKQRFRATERIKDKNPELTFSEVVAAFSGGRLLHQVREHFPSGVDFQTVLEWLVSNGLLVQLARYCHFLPSRGKQAADARGKKLREVNLQLRARFCQQLTESELLLLAARASDDHQLSFLCKFAVDFARAHRRIDSSDFVALVRQFEQQQGAPPGQAERLLTANKDIFVPYICRC